MNIRRALDKDADKVIALLSQVLEVHANIRPDIFVSGTTKYTRDELSEMFRSETNPIYVAVDDNDEVMGYAFCELRQQPFSNNMVQFKSLFIDDLCVDESLRGQRIGEALFEYVKAEAKRLGCHQVTLNVWEGNTPAQNFYNKMGMKIKEYQMEIDL